MIDNLIPVVTLLIGLVAGVMIMRIGFRLGYRAGLPRDDEDNILNKLPGKDPAEFDLLDEQDKENEE